ncbi:MFS transporter [Actinomadura rudentiformis]|uniref:MFS transporter n=1 Tax=Actinomadura rudentiformis TaxID=359158 RepID=A0A6H9Z755_9ACTN|nr:MFS transporter [Actinomadura rudentiformis]KAB2351020.1 MFS transporter [Actinomadura rudentiformis]
MRGPYRTPTLGIVLTVTLLAFEAMAVTTVMPVTARDLNGLSLYAWGFSGTLIASVLATVLAGGWIDRSGPAKPLLIGLAVFVAGLAIAGAAPTMVVFVLGRVVQGLGTGVAMVASYVLIARVYPESLRPRVFAALAAAWVLPSLIGPAIGGAVAEHIGWRWVFLGLIPLVIPAAAMLVPAFRNLKPAEHAPAGRAGATRYIAAVAVAAGAGLLLYGLDNPGLMLIPAAAAGLAGLAYGLPKLVPAGTLRMRRGLPSVVVARGLLAGAFFGTDVFIPLALTSLHGFSATQAGIVLTVAALGWSAASQIQGRSRRPQTLFVLLGAVFTTVGVVAVTVTLQLSGWWSAPAWTIGGFGMGFAISALSVLMLNQSAEEEQGVNSSALQISDTLGSSVVVGLAGALVTGFGTDHLEQGLIVAGLLFTAIAALAVVSAFRLEADKA